MNKVVINNCYGGFSLSMKALQLLYKKLGKGEYNYPYEYNYEDGMYHKCSLKKSDCFSKEDLGDSVNVETIEEKCVFKHYLPVPRHNKDLISVVEELGKEAYGSYAKLKVVEIPGNMYRINEYDGWESVEIPESLDWVTIS